MTVNHRSSGSKADHNVSLFYVNRMHIDDYVKLTEFVDYLIML